MLLGKRQRKYGMNNDISRQSSLTSEKHNETTKENIHKSNGNQDDEHSTSCNEYNFMDGVLGCIKV
jgi:hypothetical protein